MTERDALALGLSLGYVVVVLAGSLALRRGRLSPRTLRSLVHIAVGLWIVPTVVLFQSRWAAAVPPLLFVGANALRRPARLYRALDERRAPVGSVPSDNAASGRLPIEGAETLLGVTGASGCKPLDWGLVLFPASVAAVILLWWPEPVRVAVVVGVLTLALGDSAAALVGRRWGRTRWTRLLRGRTEGGSGKTVEGSAALWLASVLVTLAAFLCLPHWPLPRALLAAVAAATAATAVEALTPGRLDNLTIPLATSAVARLALAWGTIGP